MSEQRYAVYSDCIHTPSSYVIEGFSLERDKHKVVAAYDTDNAVSDMRNVLDLSTAWLPLAAEKYFISANIKDYVFVPVCIFSSVLPNRNAVAFPLEKLVEFNPESGQCGFETFRRKCLFKDHNNKDITKSYGTIFDSKMFPMRKSVGGLFKTVLLTGWDRTKNPELVNDILTGKRDNYSMGSWSNTFFCSICGNDYGKNGDCEHIKFGKPDTMREYNGKLSYLNVGSVCGFETSSVNAGAFHQFSQSNKELLFTL